MYNTTRRLCQRTIRVQTYRLRHVAVQFADLEVFEAAARQAGAEKSAVVVHHVVSVHKHYYLSLVPALGGGEVNGESNQNVDRKTRNDRNIRHTKIWCNDGDTWVSGCRNRAILGHPSPIIRCKFLKLLRLIA